MLSLPASACFNVVLSLFSIGDLGDFSKNCEIFGWLLGVVAGDGLVLDGVFLRDNLDRRPTATAFGGVSLAVSVF